MMCGRVGITLRHQVYLKMFRNLPMLVLVRKSIKNTFPIPTWPSSFVFLTNLPFQCIAVQIHITIFEEFQPARNHCLILR